MLTQKKPSSVWTRFASVFCLAMALFSANCVTAPRQPVSYGQRPYPPQPYQQQPYYPGPSSGPSSTNNGAPLGRAQNVMLIDARTGQQLAARNADSPHGAASTQKLLTALVVADAGNLYRQVTVMPEDTRVQPTVLGLKPGNVHTRGDLLSVMLVKSTNDVANVLARDVAGSVPAFAERMNAKARSLGCTNSNFVNPHGLTARGQYSTARDMSKIALAAYRNPVIRNIVRQGSYTFRFNNGRTVTHDNTNKILDRMSECNGMKTGYTTAAGRCLVSSASNGRRDVIAVQLGTQTKYIWDDGEGLMRWGLNGGNGGGYAARY